MWDPPFLLTNIRLHRRQVLSPIDSPNQLQKVVTRNDVESDRIHHSRKVNSAKPLKRHQIKIYSLGDVHSLTRHPLLQPLRRQPMKHARRLCLTMKRQSEASKEHKETIAHTSLLFESHRDHHTRCHKYNRNHELQGDLEDAIGNVVHNVWEPRFSLLHSRMVACVANGFDHATSDGIANRCSASSVQVCLQKRSELYDSTETPEKRNRETNRPPHIGSNPARNRSANWLRDTVNETSVEISQKNSRERHHDDDEGKVGSEESRE